MTDTNTRVYLTNLGKYNEGALIGKWVDLPCSDIEAELLAIGVKEDTAYEEAFITDYETDLPIKIGEYENLEELSDLIGQVEDLEDYQLEHLKAYIEASGIKLADALSDFEDASTFYPDVNSFSDLAEQMVDEGLFGDIPQHLLNYIDYEAIGRDLSCDGYYEVSNGIISLQ